MYRQNFVAITFVITTIFVTSTVITSQGQYVAVQDNSQMLHSSLLI